MMGMINPFLGMANVSGLSRLKLPPQEQPGVSRERLREDTWRRPARDFRDHPNQRRGDAGSGRTPAPILLP